MTSVKAIYDGTMIHFTDPVPVKGKYEVTVTFTKPVEETDDVEEKKQRLLRHAGTWDIEFVNLIEQMKEEQRNLPKRQRDVDIS